MEDKMPYMPPMPSVDVRDVSQAHLNAIKFPAAANQRFILVQKLLMHQDVAKPLKDEFGKFGWNFEEGEPEDSSKIIPLDNAKS
jgi:nucleoside-diphosphate-sugar epimerase